MYVVNHLFSVSAINTRGESFTIGNVGTLQSHIAYNPDNQLMYVTDTGNSRVVMIDGNQVVGEIPVGYGPTGIAYNPVDKKMYVANTADNTVSTVAGTRVVGDPVRVGLHPEGIAYNPDNNKMYVTNKYHNTVSVIDPTLPSPSAQLVQGAICPETYVQHLDKIVFMINSSKIARSLNLTANTELDIRVQDSPKEVTDIKQEVLNFLGIPNATRNTISIIDVDYSALCASSEDPIVLILSPPNQSHFSPDQMITFKGQGQDAEDGQLTGTSLKWTSDRDGDLGTGREISTVLSGPTNPCRPDFLDHTVTLTGTDKDGNSASSKILVSVGAIC